MEGFMIHRHSKPFGSPPERSPLPAINISGFFDAVEQALQLHIKTEGNPEGLNPVFVHSFPKERVAKPDQVLDLITFRVISSEMAPTLNDGSKPRSPVLRENTPDHKLGGYNKVVWGWRELVNAEFCIWSKSNLSADVITTWFHDFMVKFAFVYQFFKVRGVQNFRFVKRDSDEVNQSFGQELYTRRLQYEFTLETLFVFEHKQLTDIDIIYGIKNPDGKCNQVDTISIVADPIPKGE
jgi:hypothetical protein